MRGLQRVVEHGVQRRGDLFGRVRGVEEAGRRAGFKTVRNFRDVVVGVGVFITSKAMIHGIDLLIGNIEHGNDDVAALECFAFLGGVYHGRVVAVVPGAVGNVFVLVVLCAVGDEE